MLGVVRSDGSRAREVTRPSGFARFFASRLPTTLTWLRKPERPQAVRASVRVCLADRGRLANGGDGADRRAQSCDARQTRARPADSRGRLRLAHDELRAVPPPGCTDANRPMTVGALALLFAPLVLSALLMAALGCAPSPEQPALDQPATAARAPDETAGAAVVLPEGSHGPVDKRFSISRIYGRSRP
jgi:hypothetical protein